MNPVDLFSKAELDHIIRKRGGEKKLGESISFVKRDWIEELKISGASFVIIGIPEDIGVRANLGRAGAGSAVKPAIESILNLQSNLFLDGSSILLLGQIAVNDLLDSSATLDQNTESGLKTLRELVSLLDER